MTKNRRLPVVFEVVYTRENRIVERSGKIVSAEHLQDYLSSFNQFSRQTGIVASGQRLRLSRFARHVRR